MVDIGRLVAARTALVLRAAIMVELSLCVWRRVGGSCEGEAMKRREEPACFVLLLARKKVQTML